jgi:hypothetical protein
VIFQRRRVDDRAVTVDQDGIHVYLGFGECREELRGGRSFDPVNVLLHGVRDTGDHRLLEHSFVLLANPGSASIREAGADVHHHIVIARELDRA